MKTKNDDPLIGVVMCGGLSSRMGKDKGLIKDGDKTWAEAAYHKLRLFTEDVYISINSSQHQSYSEIFSEDKLIPDNIALKGPLAGLFSVHKSLPEKDLFLLACDMLRVDSRTLKNLFQEYKTHKSLYDFFVYKRNVNYETLAGIYTGQGTSKMYNSYLKDSFFKQSIKYILETGNTYAIKIRSKAKFANYNSPEDIR